MTPLVANKECRAFHDYETRADGAGFRVFEGHAAVFDEWADIAGMFRESVAPGSFKKTLKEANVPFVFNHDDSTVMARSAAGNLKLSEDDSGLYVEARLDERDHDVRQLLTKMENGNVSGMSFAFAATRDEWDDEPEDEGLPQRTLREVRLYDVSPVTNPAYPGTDAAIRSELRAFMAERGVTLHDPDEIQDAATVTPDGTPLDEHLPDTSLEHFRMRLVIAKNRMPLLGVG